MSFPTTCRIAMMLVLAAAVAPAQAASPNGFESQTIYSNLTSTGIDDLHFGLSTGFLFGVFTMLLAARVICPPPGQDISVGQINKMFTNYMDKNPGRWQELPPLLVKDALVEAGWGCRR